MVFIGLFRWVLLKINHRTMVVYNFEAWPRAPRSPVRSSSGWEYGGCFASLFSFFLCKRYTKLSFLVPLCLSSHGKRETKGPGNMENTRKFTPVGNLVIARGGMARGPGWSGFVRSGSFGCEFENGLASSRSMCSGDEDGLEPDSAVGIGRG